MKRRFLCVGLSLALILAVSFPGYAAEAAPDEATPAESSDSSFPADETTPPVDEGETTPPIDEGETTPPVDDGETTPPVDEGETTPPVDDGANMPDNGVPPVEDDVFSTPVIQVEAPISSRIILNPYGMKVRLGSEESTDPVVSANDVLRNYSVFPVRVSAAVTGSAAPGSSVVFTQAPPDAGTAEKAVFLYLEFQGAADATDVPAWTGIFRDGANQLLVNGPGKDDVLTLAAGTEGMPGVGMLRMFGQLAMNPAELWTASDTVNVAVSLTFTAVDNWADYLPPPAEPAPPVVPDVPAEPVTPTEPETPAEPVTPTEPEIPAEPVTPTEPETPTEPVTPIEPETPTEPATPIEPETPTEPETPAESVTPTEPETPSEPVTPTEPETPAEPATPIEPETPAESVTPVVPETPAEPL